VTGPHSLLNPAAIRPRLETLGTALLNACGDIEFAYLFGSAARGELTSRSDIDIAIHLEGHVDPTWARLEAARAATIHLGTDAVDLVVLNTAPLAIAGRILTSRLVILDRVPFRRHAYESATARMFSDFRLREHRLLSARFGRG
jgi:predicted nucleotidyltransferase